MEFILNHAMSEAFEPGLSELADGQPASMKYLFIPLYSRKATTDEQQKWLANLADHVRSLYDATQLRFNLEFRHPDAFSATPYVGVIEKGQTLEGVITHDLHGNIGYKEGESFKIQSIEYRDTVTDGGEDMPRIIVRADLSYPVDVSSVEPHGLEVFWTADDEETYGVKRL